MPFHELRLANGLQIIAEQSPGMHSVAVGFFVRTGSRDETPAVSGVSHFLEHMAFKGTARHSADDVNRVFDELGAKYNASTSEEQTIFYAAVLPEYLPKTLDLLADILRPQLRQDDFDMEKKVILEEIGMYEDQPSHTAYETGMQTHFAGHSLGSSVLGSSASVAALSSEQMRGYHQERYAAGNIVLVAAGNFDWDELKSLAEAACGSWPSGDPPRPIPEAHPKGGVTVVPKDNCQQQHVMQLAAAPPADHPLRHAAELLSVIVGDDTGSRFFWNLVDPGHAESADLGYNEFDGSGAYFCYMTCPPEEAEANLQRIQEAYDDVNRNGVSETELKQARSKVLSRIVLRSERPMGRLGSLGMNWLYRKEYCTVADDLKAFKAVTVEDIRKLLELYPLKQQTTVAVGPLKTLSVPK